MRRNPDISLASRLTCLEFSINIHIWHRNYIQLGCVLKWQISEAYIAVAKITGQESHYYDALSSWIYSGTNDALKSMLIRLKG